MPRQQTLEPLTLTQNDISTLAYSLFLFRSFSCISLSTATYSQSSFLFPLPLLIILFRSLIPLLSLWSLSTHTAWEIITNLTNHNHHHHIFRPHHTVTPSQNQPKHIRWLKPNSILPRPPPSDLVTPKPLSKGSSASGHVSLVSLFLSKTPTSSKIRFKTEKKIVAVWLPPEMVVAIFHMRDRPSHGSLGTMVP